MIELNLPKQSCLDLPEFWCSHHFCCCCRWRVASSPDQGASSRGKKIDGGLLLLFQVFFSLCGAYERTPELHWPVQVEQTGGKGWAAMSEALIGSRPPRCEGKCAPCGRCEAVQVPVAPRAGRLRAFFFSRAAAADDDDESSTNYKPLNWKCRCADTRRALDPWSRNAWDFSLPEMVKLKFLNSVSSCCYGFRCRDSEKRFWRCYYTLNPLCSNFVVLCLVCGVIKCVMSIFHQELDGSKFQACIS